MSAIGDELRLVADDMERNPDVVQHFSPAFLRGLACRIDDAMVEWPLGADKKPIKPSQTVYKAINGDDGEYVVHSLRCSVPGWVALIKRVGTDSSCIVRPDVLTHERPDSLERIADELDAWCDQVDVDGNACGEPRELARRIRRLAEEREHERE